MGHWAGFPPHWDWVTTPSRYRLISCIPFPFHWETSSFDLFLVWGCREQASRTILHCTRRAVCASSNSAKSTSGGGRACWSTLYGGGWASGGRSRDREYVETRWILSDHGAMSVRHQLPWNWHHWACDIGCDPAGVVACREGHNLQVRAFDTCTKNRHATWADVGRYTQGNLQTMLPKPVFNDWRCHLHRARCNTSSRCWDFV